MVFELSKELQFSVEVLEVACDSIIDEIIDFLIEGICFDIHRAVKLGYYPIEEYAVNELQFEIFKGVENPGEGRDIYFNDCSKKVPMSTCQFCGQKKAATSLVRHMNICRSRPPDQPIWSERPAYQAEKPIETGAEKGIKNLSIRGSKPNTDNYVRKAFSPMKLTAIFDAQMKIT